MKPERRAALEVAFNATCYQVNTDEGYFDLRIGVIQPLFDAFLAARGVTRWALLTACNPGAVMRSDKENAHATKTLLAKLDSRGWQYYSTSHRADGGAWPIEEGVLLIGIDRKDAVRLAIEYCQLACIIGDRGHAPVLLWV